MALIKNVNSERLLRDAVVLDLGDLDRQAHRIISQAQAHAAQTLQDARGEVQRLIDEADERGYSQGVERGIEEGRAVGLAQGREQSIALATEQLRSISDRWKAALDDWESQRGAMLEQAYDDVLRFAFALAERVVHRVIQTDPTIIKDQLTHALMMVLRSTAAEVRVSPSDFELTQELLPELVADAGRCEHVTITPMESISRGGCIIRTANGQIDATIATQLDRIVTALVPQMIQNARETRSRKDDSEES